MSVEEESFLRFYSDSLARASAMVHAGLAPPEALDVGTRAHAEAMAQAGRILAKAERMPLQAIASAVGADLLYFFIRLKAVCDSDELHQAIKGLQLLGRIHGIWSPTGGKGRRNLALILGEPQGKPEPKRVQGLPFVVHEQDTAPRGTPDTDAPPGNSPS